MKTIKKSIEKIKLIKNLWIKEKNSHLRLNKATQVQMFTKGFLSHSKVMYNLNKNNYNMYLTDIQQTKTGNINGNHSYLLNNKVAFERVFSRYVSIPKTLATIIDGKVLSFEQPLNDIDDFLLYLETNNKVIIKPIIGSKGKGVFTLELRDSNLYFNNKPITKDDLKEKIKQLDQYFISEFINQGNFSKKFYPSSVNTIRIVTMINPHTKEPFIPAAVQRIGTSQSKPMDNFSQGGLNASIDLETGTLSQAVSYPYSGKMEWHDYHPDTTSQIEGVVIPNWEEVKESILEVARNNSYIKYVGWDVVLGQSGIIVMEGNSWPDIDLLQVHKPLLEDNRVYEFYKYHKIL